MKTIFEFVEAYWVECLIWGVIIVSSATMCAMSYAKYPCL